MKLTHTMAIQSLVKEDTSNAINPFFDLYNIASINLHINQLCIASVTSQDVVKIGDDNFIKFFHHTSVAPNHHLPADAVTVVVITKQKQTIRYNHTVDLFDDLITSFQALVQTNEGLFGCLWVSDLCHFSCEWVVTPRSATDFLDTGYGSIITAHRTNLYQHMLFDWSVLDTKAICSNCQRH